MKKALITVIIPIYNCEEYLRNCFDSVVSQTLKDIEVILINDCSTDGSQNIINQYSRNDSRFVSIQLGKNVGVSAARNSAIDAAKGDYIIFLDADDSWSDNTMLNMLFETAVENNADIVNFGFRMLSLNGQQQRVKVGKKQVVDLKRSDQWHFNYSPISHLISRKLIDGHAIRFDPILVMGEDCLFNITLYCYASKLVILDKVFYNYQLRMNSANTSVWSKHKLNCTMLWFESAIQVIKESPVIKFAPRLLQELIFERLHMLTRKLLMKAFVTFDERELQEYINLCARNLGYLDKNYFDSQFFPNGWPALQRSVVDMIFIKDLAGLRALYPE